MQMTFLNQEKKKNPKPATLMLLSAPPSNAAPTQQQGQAERPTQVGEEIQLRAVSGALGTGDAEVGSAYWRWSPS